LIQKNQKIKAALDYASAANDTSQGADKALGVFNLIVFVENEASCKN
jgi:hypothetical protein